MYTKQEEESGNYYESILKKVEKSLKDAYPAIHLIWHFGAIEYGPQYLVQCIAFKTDIELQQAMSDGECDKIAAYWKETMVQFGWPSDAFVHKIGRLTTQYSFASQETCDREFAGNWWYYYK